MSKELTNAPEVEAELRSIIGSVHRALGDWKKAEEMDREALRLRKTLFGETNVFVAESLYHLAWDLSEMRRHAEAEAVARQALEMRKSLFGPGHLAFLYSQHQLAVILGVKGDKVDAEAMLREVLVELELIKAEDKGLVRMTLESLGNVLKGLNKLSEAEEALGKAVRLNTEISSTNNPSLATTLVNLGDLLGLQGKHAEAADVTRQALAIFERLLDDMHPSLELVRNNLAFSLSQLGNFTEAESLLWKVFRGRTNQYGYTHPKVASQLDRIARLQLAQGRWAEAESRFRELLSIHKALNEPDLAQTVRGVAETLVNQGKQAELEEFLRALCPAGQIKREDAPLLTARGDVYALHARWNEAKSDFMAAIELNPANHLPYHGLAATLVWTGDLSRHRDLRQKILVQFNNVSALAAAANPLAKDCLIVPLPADEMERVAPLVTTAMRGGHQFVNALFHYRCGEFTTAIELSEKAMSTHSENPSRQDGLAVDYTVLAMARFRSGHVESARAALAKAMGLNGSNGDNPRPIGAEGDTYETLYREILLREARLLINSETNVSEKQ